VVTNAAISEIQRDTIQTQKWTSMSHPKRKRSIKSGPEIQVVRSVYTSGTYAQSHWLFSQKQVVIVRITTRMSKLPYCFWTCFAAGAILYSRVV